MYKQEAVLYHRLLQRMPGCASINRRNRKNKKLYKASEWGSTPNFKSLNFKMVHTKYSQNYIHSHTYINTQRTCQECLNVVQVKLHSKHPIVSQRKHPWIISSDATVLAVVGATNNKQKKRNIFKLIKLISNDFAINFSKLMNRYFKARTNE